MYHTILVPLDGSERGEMILPHVEMLANCFNSRVILLNVIEPVHILTSAESVDVVEASLEASEVHEAEIYLAGVVGRLREQGIQVDTIVEYGPPVKHIVEVAEREEADLIAMASHGLTGLARVFYGSVAAGVLHRIDRPLLIIRADGA